MKKILILGSEGFLGTVLVPHLIANGNIVVGVDKCFFGKNNLPNKNFKLYKKDYNHFKNLKYLVIDCLRFNKHPSHFNLEDVLKIVNLFKPKKTILTNLHSDLDYNQLLKILPNDILPGYDGLSVNI